MRHCDCQKLQSHVSGDCGHPLVTASCGHLYTLFFSFSFDRDFKGKKPNPPLHFTKSFPSLFRNATQFRMKIRSDKSSFTKIMCLTCLRRRKRKRKKGICDCVTWIIFFSLSFVRLLNKITGQFLFGNVLLGWVRSFWTFYSIMFIRHTYNFF